MTDVWDLSAYVEAHPDNLDQRWRLAKKLYTAFEYRLALEHLQVLKNDWGPRANVMRYLAATYFRLGRYDEAIREIREALAKYPDDLGMHEQYARTLVVAKRKQEALAQWKKVQELCPDHAIAGRAIENLQKHIDKENKEKEEVARAKSGADFSEVREEVVTELTCPSCGEKNSPEFQRCWKCHALLGEAPAPAASAFVEPAAPAPVRIPYPIVSGILIAGLLALGVFLTLRGFSSVEQLPPGEPPRSALGFLESILLWTRVGVGAALLLGWPIGWFIAARSANVEHRIYNDTLYQYGALLALLTFSLLWLPWRWMAAAAAAPIAISAIVVFFGLRLRPKEALRFWIVQLAVAVLVAAAVIVGRHGPGIITTAPQIAAFAARSNDAATFSSPLSVPGEIRVVWSSSGSRWLDRHGSKMQLTLAPGEPARQIFLETLKDGLSLSYQPVRGASFSTGLPNVEPGSQYIFRIKSKQPMSLSFTVKGLLPAKVETAVTPAPSAPPGET